MAQQRGRMMVSMARACCLRATLGGAALRRRRIARPRLGGQVLGGLLAVVAFAGCSATPSRRDFDRLYVKLTPIEYARPLCRPEPMVARHSCMTSVVEHHRRARHQPRPGGDAVEGPFVASIDLQRYRGRYVSNPFAAAVTVTNGTNVCRGRYNAFAGDREPLLRFHCSDGRHGAVRIVLGRTGRNGIDEWRMADGASGAIVFSCAAVPETLR